MAKGMGPGFELGRLVNQPRMHRWHHVGKLPETAAVAWVKDVKPDFDQESWKEGAGLYVSVDEKLLLLKEEDGFRLMVWRKPD